MSTYANRCRPTVPAKMPSLDDATAEAVGMEGAHDSGDDGYAATTDSQVASGDAAGLDAAPSMPHWGDGDSVDGSCSGAHAGRAITPHAERPLWVSRFDPTRGVSITVNIGTAAVLYTLHDTFDPLRWPWALY